MLSKHSLNQGTNERMSNSLVWVTRSVQGEWEAFAHLWRIPGWRVTTQWTLGCACPGSTEVLVLEHLQRCFRIFIDLDFISLIPGMRRTRSSCSMSVFAVICCDETPTRKNKPLHLKIWTPERNWVIPKEEETRITTPMTIPASALSMSSGYGADRTNIAESGKLHELKRWGWACQGSRQRGFAGK